MMNVKRLKARMIMMGKTVDGLCSALGISRTAWFRKTTGTSQFTQQEISLLRRELALDNDETAMIFFDEEVA
ncbi:MAG: hypothetical protein IJ188_08210 [Clostridia bacterium]|nr:hypothetical protein [Clostridia bacterium]